MELSLKEQILKYELTIHNSFLEKRKKLIDNINGIDFNNLSNDQINIFINDIKMIIDPIKTSCENINYYFTNLDLIKTDSIDSITELSKVIIFYNFFFRDLISTGNGKINESEESEEPDELLELLESDSESSESPESSEPDPSSSKSSSVTFSNNYSIIESPLRMFKLLAGSVYSWNIFFKIFNLF